jgi:hypothetical protein
MTCTRQKFKDAIKLFIFLNDTTALCGPEPPQSRSFTITITGLLWTSNQLVTEPIYLHNKHKRRISIHTAGFKLSDPKN